MPDPTTLTICVTVLATALMLRGPLQAIVETLIDVGSLRDEMSRLETAWSATREELIRVADSNADIRREAKNAAVKAAMALTEKRVGRPPNEPVANGKAELTPEDEQWATAQLFSR